MKNTFKLENFMKKAFCFGLSCAVLLMVLGCQTTSTAPVVYTNNESTKFVILGEIRYESGDRTGYAELLRAARNLYPDCAYVIDMMIDQKTVRTYFLFFKVSESVTHTMRGTAIKYIR
jgi:hypothetical protein